MAGIAVTTDPPLPSSGTDSLVSVARTYVGDGMPPVPAMLAAKNWRWEYVEMEELLPEFWVGPKENSEPLKECHVRQGSKVTVLGFNAATVLVPIEPLAVPELMVYMGIFMRVLQDYKGLRWV